MIAAFNRLWNRYSKVDRTLNRFYAMPEPHGDQASADLDRELFALEEEHSRLHERIYWKGGRHMAAGNKKRKAKRERKAHPLMDTTRQSGVQPSVKPGPDLGDIPQKPVAPQGKRKRG